MDHLRNMHTEQRNRQVGNELSTLMQRFAPVMVQLGEETKALTQRTNRNWCGGVFVVGDCLWPIVAMSESLWLAATYMLCILPAAAFGVHYLVPANICLTAPAWRHLILACVAVKVAYCNGWPEAILLLQMSFLMSFITRVACLWYSHVFSSCPKMCLICYGSIVVRMVRSTGLIGPATNNDAPR